MTDEAQQQLADAFANGGPDAFYAEKSRQVRAIQLRRFSERMVEDARLNAQRVKQRAWNVVDEVRPTQATPLVAALTEAYGYVYSRVHSVVTGHHRRATREVRPLTPGTRLAYPARRGVEKPGPSRQPYKLKITGSNPVPATN